MSHEKGVDNVVDVSSRHVVVDTYMYVDVLTYTPTRIDVGATKLYACPLASLNNKREDLPPSGTGRYIKILESEKLAR